MTHYKLTGIVVFVLVLLLMLTAASAQVNPTPTPIVATPTLFPTATPIPQARPTITAVPLPARPADDPSPQVVSDQRLASVLVPRLNVRSAPSVDNSVVITIVKIGEVYPVYASNNDETWWQINVNGTLGWVFADLVIVVNAADVPAASELASAFYEAFNAAIIRELEGAVVVSGSVNIRRGPGTQFPIVGRTRTGDVVYPQGRDAFGTWYYVQYGATLGWMSGAYLNFPPDFIIDTLPVIPG